MRDVVSRIEQLPVAQQETLAEAMRSKGDPREARRREAGIEALDRLAELTADLPIVEAVRVARESRDDLDGRASG
jgi:hypothetical protein